MLRDPFYRDVEDALKKRVDPETFERCAQDLLRSVYPRLVPIRGGKDAGMDGAIGDLEGEAYPLVTTVGNVRRNLRTSLQSYVKNGKVRRKVVFATSKVLTAPQRRHLEAIATEIGFTLVQVHDGADFANRLYRDPPWCRELLGLSGRPALLIRESVSRRPKHTGPLIGREDAICAIRDIPGDRVLVGQPGAGKTVLIEHLIAQKPDWYFLAAGVGGEEQLTNNIRQFNPKVVALDDAHIFESDLSKLYNLRQQIRADFEIIATCWPASESRIRDMLAAGPEKVISLSRLTRDEIKEIIENYFSERHRKASKRLLSELIDQAGGQPGLAVTISKLCADGDLDRVLTGEALREDLFQRFDNLVGPLARDILATISIGGNQGLTLTDAAECLGINVSEARRIVTHLASAGVVKESGDHLVVLPKPLRCALANASYFSGAASLDVSKVLDRSRDLDASSIMLIACRGRGGAVSDDLLYRVMDRVTPGNSWRALATLGQEESTWIIRNRPQQIADIERQLLENAPDEMIPVLLNQSLENVRSSTKDHGLELISQWIQSSNAENSDAADNRVTLAKSVERWIPNAVRGEVAVDAMCMSLDPTFHLTEIDAGSGSRFTTRWGLLLLSDLEKTWPIWDRLLNILPEHGLSNWCPVLDAVERWAYPQRHSRGAQKAEMEYMRDRARLMISSLLDRWPQHKGLLRWTLDLGEAVSLQRNIAIDVDFLVIYPLQCRGTDWQPHYEKRLADIRELATRWQASDPKQITIRIGEFEREISSVGITHDRLTPYLAGYLAQGVESPFDWADALVNQQVPADVVEPFLLLAVSIEGFNGRINNLLRKCFDGGDYPIIAALAVLSRQDAREDLLLQAIVQVKKCPKHCEIWIARDLVASPHIHALLTADDEQVRLATVWGIWERDSDSGIPAVYQDEALAALLDERAPHRVQEVLRKHPSFAKKWLLNAIDRQVRHNDDAIAAAVIHLSLEERHELIERLDRTDRFDPDVLLCLIGQNVELFKLLLSLESGRLKKWHLRPLEDSHCRSYGHPGFGPPDREWIGLAVCALDAGYSEDEIVREVLHSGAAYSGSESSEWEQRRERWQQLKSAEDARIRSIGSQLTEVATIGAERSFRREREEAVWGD